MTDAYLVTADRRAAQNPADLLDPSIDCVKALSLDGRLLSMNPEGLCLMEIDDFTPLHGAEWTSLWPEPHRPTLEAAVAAAARGKVARFSADCPTAKGTPKHWDVVVSPVHNHGGELVSLLAISRDVTRETLIAGERALVTRELAHRIANIFAVVDGVISLSARAEPAVKSFARALQNRIASLARATAYVYSGSADEPAAGAYSVHGLFHQLLSPYQQERTADSTISLVGDDYELTPSAFTPFSLIINELATNALKYGALSQPSGRVQVSTKLIGANYAIAWRETGVADVRAPATSGFGTTLLDRTVKLHLGASLSRDWRADGLVVEMTIPLRSLR